MCGICGELGFSGAPAARDGVARMSAALVHRGPDDAGLFCEGPIGLGHRRLAILDLSPAGRQPMWSADGALCIVFNGEVYNFRELRRELLARGYGFDSQTDTEVVLNAVHHWGLDGAVSRFIGMFAFAVWDTRTHTLSLCRDRAGVKPLYYHLTDRALLFGSELKALLAHPAFTREIDTTAVAQHLVTGHAVGERTVFRNTSTLAPGHILSVDASGVRRTHAYWSLGAFERGSYQGTFEEAVEELDGLCQSAIGYRLIADVPVGLFFSGGIDSSLVSAVLAKRLRADVVNITVGFEDPAYDESPRARRISAELGTRQIVHRIGERDIQDALPTFIDTYDEPFSDTSGIPTRILSGLARQHVKVALSADGGDEQFGGYESYRAYDARYTRLARLPERLRELTAAVLQRCVPHHLLSRLARERGSRYRYQPQFRARYEKMLRLMRVADEADLVRLAQEAAWPADRVQRLVGAPAGDLFDGTPLARDLLAQHQGELVDTMMRTDFVSYLRNDILVKTDRASMAVSLECREPLLDHRITELAARLPLRYLIGDVHQKRPLRALLERQLGPEHLTGSKKGFVIPLYYWLRGVWRPAVDDYLSEDHVRRVGLMDPQTVRNEVRDFYAGRGGRAEKIWAMLNLQMWAERWHRAPAPPQAVAEPAPIAAPSLR